MVVVMAAAAVVVRVVVLGLMLLSPNVNRSFMLLRGAWCDAEMLCHFSFQGRLIPQQ